MSAKIIDFYEGAARSLGFESMAALDEAYWIAIDAEMAKTQAICLHPYVTNEFPMCMECGKECGA